MKKLITWNNCKIYEIIEAELGCFIDGVKNIKTLKPDRYYSKDIDSEGAVRACDIWSEAPLRKTNYAYYATKEGWVCMRTDPCSSIVPFYSHEEWDAIAENFLQKKES